MSELKLYISDDYYKSYLTIKFTPDHPVEVEDILSQLNERSITYGTDMEVITALCKLKENVYDELIAEGQPHMNGVDSQIILTFKESENVHPTLLENGTVDFKNLNLLQKVSKGETLAIKIPATEGIDGMTVTGKVIHAKNGKDTKFSFGENIELLDDELSVVAACDGVYKCEDGKMTVQSYLEFNEGIGLHTGNVSFKGDIFITGDVINDHIVDCDGNLTINGLVEGATLNVTGDLSISKGISGHNVSKVICGGNLITKFIDNAEVIVHGNLEAGEILNCKVLCDGEVIVKGKKGHIVGGEITAKYAINATTIGSKLGVITLINLGVNIESVQELKALRAGIENEIEIERKLKQFVTTLKMKEVKGILTEEEKDIFDKCLDNLKQTQYIIKEKKSRINALRELFRKAQNGQIKTETIYPDTMVKIGKSSFFIDEAILRKIIKKSDDEIIAIEF